MSPRTPFPPVALPAGIAFAFVGPDQPAEPLPEERALLSARVLPERVAEFARGRSAARLALTGLGVPGAECMPILRVGPRAPRWPDGIVGTIAHSGGWAAAACARRGTYRGVGIDLERVRPMKNTLAARIMRPDELAAWQSLPAEAQPLAFAATFSAKESIYKALFPATGIFLGYQDASIDWRPHPHNPPLPEERGEVELRWTLWRDSGVEFPVGFRGEGRAWTGDGMVLTAVWV